MMNYHFHDEHSSDGTRPLIEHCVAARRAGFLQVCVTNHAETSRDGDTWKVDFEEAVRRFERIHESVARASEILPDLAIRFGAEFAFRPEWTASLERLADRLPFDFVLGSLHDVDGIDVSGARAAAFFEDRTVEQSYGRYFEALTDLVEWGEFDAVAHFDLVKRYGHRCYGDYDPAAFEQRIRPVLEAMRRGGIGLEVNTSGTVQLPRAPFPDQRILVWAREEGVPFLTVGSDSHAPEHFGQGIAEGLQHAAAAGWQTLTAFEKRRPAVGIPIEEAVRALARNRLAGGPGAAS